MPRELIDLPRVDRADVFKSGRLAAELRRLSDRVEFIYRAEYVNDGGAPVATTLPVTNDTTWAAAGSVPPFFAGLLPEGRRLIALRRRVKTSADDEFSLLLAVGGDTVGDVQVVPHGEDPTITDPPVLVEETWDAVDFQNLFQRSIGAEPDVTGIPGMQEKVSERMIAVPVAQGGGRYILKLNPPEFPHLVENEAFFLRAASETGISTPKFEVVTDRTGQPGLLVFRFDRVIDSSGSARMIAQEDGCQVLGRYPADKYSVSTEAVVVALGSVTGANVVAAFRLFPLIVFAYLTGNGDLHAKNLSVYQPVPGQWRIAPAYDLPSSYFYEDFTMAMPIGGDDRPTDITRTRLFEFAASIGLNERAAIRALNGQLDASEVWIDRIQELPFDERRLHKFRRFVDHRRNLLRD